MSRATPSRSVIALTERSLTPDEFDAWVNALHIAPGVRAHSRSVRALSIGGRPPAATTARRAARCVTGHWMLAEIAAKRATKRKAGSVPTVVLG